MIPEVRWVSCEQPVVRVIHHSPQSIFDLSYPAPETVETADIPLDIYCFRADELYTGCARFGFDPWDAAVYAETLFPYLRDISGRPRDPLNYTHPRLCRLMLAHWWSKHYGNGSIAACIDALPYENNESYWTAQS